MRGGDVGARILIAGMAALGFAAALAAPAEAKVFRWVQYTQSGLEARAITDDPACPAAEIDGAATAMQVRARPVAGFPNTVCALAIAAVAKSVSVDGVAMALPAAPPKRLSVLGDTGCRLKGIFIQACNDPVQWPFRQITKVIAEKKPDLIIHVGDYHYRENACPKGDSGCANSPFGDNWDAWREDFFAPAAELLAAAPWVMVRGNHEDCSRAGRGWSRMLDAGAYDEMSECPANSPPFVVQLPQMALAVIDTAKAAEPQVDEAQVPLFHAPYASLAKLASGPMWLLQHRPIWSTGGAVAGLPFGDNKTLASAASGTLPPQVQLILSGHHHLFQVLSYAEDLPVQIVSGHGGDYLNTGPSPDPKGWTVGGMTVKSGTHQVGKFGFAMIEPQGDGWIITNYDRKGVALQFCGLVGRQVQCVSP